MNLNLNKKSAHVPITVAVIDDERPARQRILDLLQQDPDVDVIGSCRNGYEALQVIEEKQPDLIFLDIQMPELGGFDVIAQIAPEKLPATVFVTAYERYALRAFEIHALDYLLKPFDDERFQDALLRVKYRIRQEKQHLSAGLLDLIQKTGKAPHPHAQLPRQRLVVKSQGEVLFVKTDEVDYIEGAGVYVYLHVGDKSYLIRERMHKLEAELDQSQFCRIHRSAIVKLTSIEKLKREKNGEYAVILKGGSKLKLSRGRQQKLQTLMGLKTEVP